MDFVPRSQLLKPTSSEVEPIWFTVPNLRSTFDLVSSCVLTLLLCVWTAIHLNISGYEERSGVLTGGTRARKFGKRLLWMLLGLVAPELVLYIAWTQFIQARSLAIHFNNAADERLSGIEYREITTAKNTNAVGLSTEASKEHNAEKGNQILRPLALDIAGGDLQRTTRYTSLFAAGSSAEASNEHDVEMANRSPAPIALNIHTIHTIDSRESDTKYGKAAAAEAESSAEASNGHNVEQGNRNKVGLDIKKQHTLINRVRRFIFPREMERGFYVLMGGIEIIPKIKLASNGDFGHGRVKEEGEGRTLTPAGALFLTKLGILPPIPVETINDKSKADLMAKLLVCVQGSWMLVQALGRKIDGLPLTLLELNTIMHVVCAILMYVLWFNKPQDVQTPLEFDSDDSFGSPLELITRVLSAQMLDLAPDDLLVLPDDNQYGVHGPNRHSLLWDQGFWFLGCKREYSKWGQERFKLWSDDRDTDRHRMPDAVCEPNCKWQYNPNTNSFRAFNIVTDNKCYSLQFQGMAEITERGADFFRSFASSKRAQFWKAEVEWDIFWEELVKFTQGERRPPTYTKYASDLNAAGDGDIEPIGLSHAKLIRDILAFLLPALYGGIHLTPWNSHFPSHLERYLWRVSGLYIASGIPALIMLNIHRIAGATFDFIADRSPLRKIYKLSTSFNVAVRNHTPRWVYYTLLWIFTIPLLILVLVNLLAYYIGAIVIIVISPLLLAVYPIARCYILIEAFASLRSLPSGAYQTVEWAEMWPHL